MTLREKLETATGFDSEAIDAAYAKQCAEELICTLDAASYFLGSDYEHARLAPILKALIDALEGYDKLLAHLMPYNKDGEMSYAVTVINETLERLEKAVAE